MQCSAAALSPEARNENRLKQVRDFVETMGNWEVKEEEEKEKYKVEFLVCFSSALRTTECNNSSSSSRVTNLGEENKPLQDGNRSSGSHSIVAAAQTMAERNGNFLSK